MSEATGFSYSTRKNGEVVILHHGRIASVLRGKAAQRFLAKLTTEDAQLLMARTTGNYKRGNERNPSKG